MGEDSLVTFPYAGIVVHASPFSGNCRGGWGGRLDIAVGEQIYILGHLQKPVWMAGDKVYPGQPVGRLAGKETNGGWRPHLHIQCIDKQEYSAYKDPRDLDAYASPDDPIIKYHHNPITKAE